MSSLLIGWTLLQVTDHAGRDFTVEGLMSLSGAHENVRIFTVTRLGEVEGGGTVLAQAAVVDGVVAGRGFPPTVIGAGGLPAGRFPVLLSPPRDSAVASPVAFEWYPASRAPGLTYALVVEIGGQAESFAGWTAAEAGPLALPPGKYLWKVVAESELGFYASEEWKFDVVPAAPGGGGGQPSDGRGRSGDRPFCSFVFSARADAASKLAWGAALAGFIGVVLGRSGR